MRQGLHHLQQGLARSRQRGEVAASYGQQLEKAWWFLDV